MQKLSFRRIFFSVAFSLFLVSTGFSQYYTPQNINMNINGTLQHNVTIRQPGLQFQFAPPPDFGAIRQQALINEQIQLDNQIKQNELNKQEAEKWNNMFEAAKISRQQRREERRQKKENKRTAVENQAQTRGDVKAVRDLLDLSEAFPKEIGYYSEIMAGLSAAPPAEKEAWVKLVTELKAAKAKNPHIRFEKPPTIVAHPPEMKRFEEPLTVVAPPPEMK